MNCRIKYTQRSSSKVKGIVIWLTKMEKERIGRLGEIDLEVRDKLVTVDELKVKTPDGIEVIIRKSLKG